MWYRVANDGGIVQRGSDKVYLSRGEFPEREEGVDRGSVIADGSDIDQVEVVGLFSVGRSEAEAVDA